MDFLADENIHIDIVGWLRDRGNDVLYAAEALQSRRDDDLLAIARQDQRVLITDDKDFGELVFHQRLATGGIVLIRLHSPSVKDRLKSAEPRLAIHREPGARPIHCDRRSKGKDS